MSSHATGSQALQLQDCIKQGQRAQMGHPLILSHCARGPRGVIRWQTLNRKEIFPLKPVILQLEDTLPQAMETNRELIKI